MPTIHLYTHLPKILADGTVRIGSDSLVAALVDSGYTYSAAHTEWSSASANEITDSAYLAQTVTGDAVTNSEIDADDVTFPAFSDTFDQAIVYANVTRNGLTNPLLFRILMDATTTISDTQFRLQFNASGIILFTLPS